MILFHHFFLYCNLTLYTEASLVPQVVKNPPVMKKTPVPSQCVRLTQSLVWLILGFQVYYFIIFLVCACGGCFSITPFLSFRIFLYLLVIYLNVSTDFELCLFVVFSLLPSLGVSNPLMPQLACILHPHVLTTPSDSVYVFASGYNMYFKESKKKIVYYHFCYSFFIRKFQVPSGNGSG